VLPLEVGIGQIGMKDNVCRRKRFNETSARASDFSGA
jgi:hypothetical protein